MKAGNDANDLYSFDNGRSHEAEVRSVMMGAAENKFLKRNAG